MAFATELVVQGCPAGMSMLTQAVDTVVTTVPSEELVFKPPVPALYWVATVVALLVLPVLYTEPAPANAAALVTFCSWLWIT
jgi:hypothetical protein